MGDARETAVEAARPADSARQTRLQRTCACGQHGMAGPGKCESCRANKSTSGRETFDAALFRSADAPAPRVGYRAVAAGAAARVFRGVTVSSPDDAAEREADQVADEVLRMPNPGPGGRVRPAMSGSPGQIRRQVDPEGPADVRRREDKREPDELLRKPEGAQERAGGAEEPGDDLAGELDRRRGGGEPLAPSVRSYFEPRFGRDLGHVRLHTDPDAGRMARQVHADAFTDGADVYFAPGHYAPTTAAGRRLLAHELTHTVQPPDATGSVLRQIRRQAAPAELPVGVDDAQGPATAPAPEAGPEPEHRQFVELRAPEKVEERPATTSPPGAPPGRVADQEAEIGKGKADLATVAQRLRAVADQPDDRPDQTGEEAGAGAVSAGAAPGGPGVAARPGGNPQAPLDGAAAEALTLGTMPMGFAARPAERSSDPSVSDPARRMRAGAESLGSRFLRRNASVARSLVDVARTAAPRTAAAAEGAKAAIDAAVATDAATLRAHVQAQRVRARREAATAVARITTGRAEAVKEIEAAADTAVAAVDRSHAAVLQTLSTLERGQVTSVDGLYATWDGSFRRVGVEVGAEAKAIGQAKADDWRGEKNGESSILDGPIDDNRLEARADAAVKVVEAYDGGLRAEADKQADAVQAGKPAVRQEVARAATETRTAVTEHHRAIRDAMLAARGRAVAQADDTAKRLTTGVRSALRATLGVLDARETQQTERLDVYAQRQSAAVDRDADAAVTAIAAGAATAVTGFTASLRDLASAASTTAVPEPTRLAMLFNDTQVQLDMAAATLLGQASSAVQASVNGLAAAGPRAVESLAAIRENATQELTATVDGLGASAQLAADQAAAGFGRLRAGQKDFLCKSEKAATDGFDEAKGQLTTAFGAVSAQTAKSFTDTREELRKGLRDSFPRMRKEIETQAKKAADAVQPRWKKWLKVTLIIAVVVAAAALTILTAGLVGPIATIAVGAAIGAVAGGAIQAGSNLIDGKKWSDGVAKAMVVGGIGGAFGGLGGQLAERVGTAVLKIGTQVGMDTIGGIVGDLAVGNPITVTGVLLGAAIGVGIGAGLAGLGALKNLRNKIAFQSAGGEIPTGARARTSGAAAVDVAVAPPTPRPRGPTVPEPPHPAHAVEPPVSRPRVPEVEAPGMRPAEADVPATRPAQPEAPPHTSDGAPKPTAHPEHPEVEPGVVAKTKTPDGRHDVKVNRDGSVDICTDCGKLRDRYRTEIDRDAGLKAEMDRIEAIPDPAAKASECARMQDKLSQQRQMNLQPPTDTAGTVDFDAWGSRIKAEGARGDVDSIVARAKGTGKDALAAQGELRAIERARLRGHDVTILTPPQGPGSKGLKSPEAQLHRGGETGFLEVKTATDAPQLGTVNSHVDEAHRQIAAKGRGELSLDWTEVDVQAAGDFRSEFAIYKYLNGKMTDRAMRRLNYMEIVWRRPDGRIVVTSRTRNVDGTVNAVESTLL